MTWCLVQIQIGFASRYKSKSVLRVDKVLIMQLEHENYLETEFLSYAQIEPNLLYMFLDGVASFLKLQLTKQGRIYNRCLS